MSAALEGEENCLMKIMRFVPREFAVSQWLDLARFGCADSGATSRGAIA
jgi:hypothetical protein